MRRLILVATVLFVLAITALAPPLPAHVQPLPWRGDLKLADRTDNGTWDGTWVYLSRDFRVVIWMRTVDGAPQLKLRYMSLAAAEGFATDWSGTAEYRVRHSEARFAMTVAEADANLVAGTWDWVLDLGGSSREEEAGFTMYRAGDGRALVVNFVDFVKRIRRGDEVRQYTTPQAWTFRKVSSRLVRWEEIFS